MYWGNFGVINNHVDSQRVIVMANNKKAADTVWDDIFDSLVLDAEPPRKYVKKVTITTRDGQVFNISPEDFSALVEHEKNLPPGFGEIASARMSLDFNRIRRDVDKWAEELMNGFDDLGKPPTPRFPKPKAARPKVKTVPPSKSKSKASGDAKTKPAAKQAKTASKRRRES